MKLSRLVAASVGLVLTGASLTVAPAAQAAVKGVPTDCGVYSQAYRSNGQRVTYGYTSGKTLTIVKKNDKLTWQPKALQQWGAAGDSNVFISNDLAVHPNGSLYDVYRRGTNTTATTVRVTRIASGWGDTRVLANSGDYLYRLTSKGLYRYTMSYSGSLAKPVSRKTVATTGWSGVKTLVFERTEGTGAAKVDVLLGTTSGGQLREWRIKQSTPSSKSAKVLKSSGWKNVTSISTGYCDKHPSGRPILAINSSGAASVWFDKNAKDGKGTDIVGGDTKTRGWTARTYGQ